MEDADLTSAARAIVFSALANAGQVCMATERVIAHESVSGELLGLVKGLVEKMGTFVCLRLGAWEMHQGSFVCMFVWI